MKMTQKHSVIGLELGAKTIKAVQLIKRPGQDTRAQALCIKRLDHDHVVNLDDLSRTRDALYRQGFRGNTIIASIPHELQLMSLVEIPASDDRAPVHAIASNQLATQYGLEPHQLECAYWRMPTQTRVHDTAQGMAVGCQNENAELLLQNFEDADFDVIALDVQSHATSRAVNHLYPTPNELDISAVMNFGWQHTCLTLILNQTVVYERTLSTFNLKSLYQKLQERFQLEEKAVDFLLKNFGLVKPTEQDLVNMSQLPAVQSAITQYTDTLINELNTALSYASHEYPNSEVAQVLLAGGGSTINGLAAHMNEDLHRPCEVFNFENTNSSNAFPGMLLNAYGLALRNEVQS